MKSEALTLSTINSILPSISNGEATYNDVAKMILGAGWQSQAGNVYQEGVRISDKIVVKYNIGHGFCYSFLNGVNIYGFDGKGMRLLASDNSYYCCYWSEQTVKNETVRLLSNFFEDYCRANGCLENNRNSIRQIATQFVEETVKATEAVGNRFLASGQAGTKAIGG